MEKWVYLARNLRDVDVATKPTLREGQVCYVDQAHGYSGPSFWYSEGARTRPSGRHKTKRVFALIYVRFPFIFFHVGLNAYLCLQATW